MANEGGQIVLSAGASDVCTREGELSWVIAVRFDGGDLMPADVGSGSFWSEGTSRVYGDITAEEAGANILATWPESSPGAGPASYRVS